MLTGIIERTIKRAEHSTVSVVRDCAFHGCTSLATASFPSATAIGDGAFQGCYKLATANFPNATAIGGSAFYSCSSLTTASFPNVTSIGASAFQGCIRLTTASFPACTSIGGSAFQGCYRLTELNLVGVPSVPTLGTNAFMSTPIGGYSASAGQYGTVLVPSSLYDAFLSAANWSSISARISSVAS